MVDGMVGGEQFTAAEVYRLFERQHGTLEAIRDKMVTKDEFTRQTEATERRFERLDDEHKALTSSWAAEKQALHDRITREKEAREAAVRAEREAREAAEDAERDRREQAERDERDRKAREAAETKRTKAQQRFSILLGIGLGALGVVFGVVQFIINAALRGGG